MQNKLENMIKKFIEEHQICCAEAVYEDRVIIDAAEFIESLCDVVGYYEEK